MTTNMWSELQNGPAFNQIVDRVTAVSRLHLSDKQAGKLRQELLDDANVQTVLPLFGYTRTSVPPSGYAHLPSSWWAQDYPYSTLFSSMARTDAMIVATPLEDGRLLQRITAAKVEERWQQAIKSATEYRSRFAQPPSLPHFLAAAVARVPGVPWQVTDDSEAIERVLHAQPFRWAPTRSPLHLHVSDTGVSVHVLCWAVLSENDADFVGTVDELAYISLVGPQKKLKAVWAFLMDSKRSILRLPQDNNVENTNYYGYHEEVRCRRIEARETYTPVWNDTPLAKSGMAHLIIQHASETKPKVGKDFLHVTGLDGYPDLGHFVNQLKAASPYPIKVEWGHDLWQAAMQRKLVRKLQSRGMTAYWVNVADPAWNDIIVHCATGQSDLRATVEVVGQAQHDLIDGAVAATDDEE